MAETLTVDDFLDDLRGLGEALSDPQQMLANMGDDIVNHMRENVPVNTGNLKSSIRWSFKGSHSIEFNMLEYGLYLNYGVKPDQFTENPKARRPGVGDFRALRAPWAEPEFGVDMGSGYQNRTFGMQARQFFSKEQITKYIQEQFLEEIIIDF
jgi:hypothetical protein